MPGPQLIPPCMPQFVAMRRLWTSHWYQHGCDVLELLILLLLEMRSGEMHSSTFSILLLSHWYKGSFGIRRPLVPPHHATDFGMN
jgi:hypothetical protein